MTTFAQEHANRLEDLRRRAEAVGSNMTRICNNTGVAIATYDRWRKRAPQSVSKVDVLEAEVLKQERLYVAPTPSVAKPTA